MLSKSYILFYTFLANVAFIRCNIQIGPDPWDYVSNVNPVKIDSDVPPDLTMTPKRNVQTNNNVGTGEWFYKRILAIVLKGGQLKKNEDGSIDISLQMKYNQERWNTLDDYIKSNTAFSEDMYRRSLGYIEEAIYKPTITEKIVLAWNEYIQYYLIEYKTQMTWTTGIVAGVITIFWLWNRISHKHILLLLFISLYAYEVFISYKEAEKQELDRFITAVNTCKWYIWTSDCLVPPPDPLIFLKHMNPLKIGIRMFTTILLEPMITISDTVKIIIHGITEELWFPLDKIMYGVLIVIFNASLIFLLIMIIFNYILNIPFKLSLLGIISVGLKQRNRSKQNPNVNETRNVPSVDNGDRISGENLSKLLDVYARALNTSKPAQITERTPQNTNLSLTYKPRMPRSASTGRLPNYEYDNSGIIENINNNDITNKHKHNGGGDAH